MGLTHYSIIETIKPIKNVNLYNLFNALSNEERCLYQMHMDEMISYDQITLFLLLNSGHLDRFKGF